MNTIGTTYMALDDIGYLHVHGADATKFLHAQFTNDLAAMTVGDAQYSGYCTPKGRLLAFMLIIKSADDDYLLVTSREVCVSILPRLRMYVMRDDVAIEEMPDEMGVFGLLGEPGACGLPAADQEMHCATAGTVCTVTLDKQSWRHLVLAEPGKFIDGACESGNESMWYRREIEQGIPRLGVATSEAFVPQMVNLDLIGAVSFKKGCYPGQEVVARVHYLGKTKQRMFLLETDTKQDITPGTAIYAADDSEKAAGTVVSAVRTGSGQLLLAVLQTSRIIDKSELHVGSINGALLALRKLPYAIPETS
jgi:folate-binding protein YgfZ